MSGDSASYQDLKGLHEVRLRRLEAGYLYLPMHLFIQGSPQNDIRRVPSMSWLITHESSNTRIVFDLGIRKDIENYPPTVVERLKTLVRADVPQDVFSSLRDAGIDVRTDVKTVIFSHLHYDHIGDPSKFGPGTQFVIGPGARDLLWGDDAYPNNKDSQFDSRTLPSDRVMELPSPLDKKYWTRLDPFAAAHDWFGDGSLYIVNSPGHLQGHINLLLRTGSEEWVYLAGDSTHDCTILHGTAQTAVYRDHKTGHPRCAHVNKGIAEHHIALIRSLKKLIPVEVILAHDSAWLSANKDRFCE